MTASNHSLHGWDSDQIALYRPRLEGADVAAVLARFPELHGPAQILWRSPRPFSAVARVRTPAGEVFVKRQHQRVRTPAALGEEHALLQHLRSRGMVEPLRQPDGTASPALAAGLPIRFSRSPATLDAPAPVPGAHTREVLSRFLGLDEAAIENLKARGVI